MFIQAESKDVFVYIQNVNTASSLIKMSSDAKYKM